MAVAGYVVASRRELGAASPFGAFLRLGLLVIGLRVLLQALLGGGVPGRTVLFTLPEIPLPAKIRTAFQPPIELDRDPERADDERYLDEKYDEVRESIQSGMDALARRRTLPLFG